MGLIFLISTFWEIC